MLILFACGKKQQKVVVDLEDLRPKPERVYEIDPDTIQIPAYAPKDVSVSFRLIFEEIYQENRFYPSDAEIFPTRFGPKEYFAVTQKDDYDSEIANWYFLSFKDSVMTDNAWLNWLDCFGASCQSLSFLSSDKINERTGHIWTNDTLIVAYFSKREAASQIKEAIKLDQFFGENARYNFYWSQGKQGYWNGIKVSKK